jgi:peptidoglycan/xylan/chitin deacetylase (PgdA/CDA1 family)
MRPWVRDAAKEGLHAVLGTRFLWRLPADSGAVGLTFDDGPDPDHTPAMLKLLAALDVKATFFVIGRNVARFPDLVRRIAAEGHALGGHTFDHREIPGLAAAELEGELRTCRAAIQDAAKVDTVLFRPPRGRMSLRSLVRVASLGYATVHWTRTYSDYHRDGTEALSRRMTEAPAKARDIILLHDHNPHTVEALAGAIPRWKSQGLGFRCL